MINSFGTWSIDHINITLSDITLCCFHWEEILDKNYRNASNPNNPRSSSNPSNPSYPCNPSNPSNPNNPSNPSNPSYFFCKIDLTESFSSKTGYRVVKVVDHLKP